ncbi:acyltransferase family protein [Raoultella ornithinolytica]
MVVEKRFDWVDYAKGIGIVLVVYGHIARGLYNSGIIPDSKVYFFLDALIYSFHMPLFFFLSGVFILKSYLSKGFRDFYFNKIDTILYPYVIWSLLQGVIEVFLSKYTNGTASIQEVLSLLWHPRAQFWFLYALFINFIFLALILKFCEKIDIKILVPVILVFSLIIYLQFASIQDVNPLNYIVHNMFFLVLGMLFYQFSIKNFLSNHCVLFFVFFTFLFLIQAFYIFYMPSDKKYDIVRIAFAIIGIGMLTSLCMVIDRHFIARIKRILSLLGIYSMPIYLMHILVGSGIRIVLYKVVKIHNFYAHIIIGVIGAIIIPIIIAIFLKKWKVELFYLPGKMSSKSIFSRLKQKV